jgi:hypothetical protein
MEHRNNLKFSVSVNSEEQILQVSLLLGDWFKNHGGREKFRYNSVNVQLYENWGNPLIILDENG